MANKQAVDERIVEMRFDNADFESKVARTLESLVKLRENSKMEDAGKGMENLSKGVKNVDINSLAANVEQLNQRFSALGIVGQEVMRNLTDAAMRMGQQVVNAITMAPKDGWKEFELNTDSIKTILNSAKDANGLPVTLDLVNQKLNELNTYSDKTIYSFSDMTSNIGKFTNAGVDLESAVTAIQGVANVAALAGASANDASRAMYNFGQALGSGSVKLIDWKSIENANMATIDFKEQLIQTALELGTVRKEGDKYVTTTTNMQGKVSDAFTASQGFNDSLSAQWMTADVLTKTLAKYTDEQTELGQKAIDAATKVNTLTKLIDTLKESMGSGWMQTWQLIVGDYEESTALWTNIYRELDGIIQKTSDFRNNLLQTWKDLGGRNDLIEAFSNLWRAAKAFVEPIRDLFLNLLPPVTGESLAKLTNGFKEFTARLAPIKEATEEIKEKVEEGAKAVETVTDRAEKFNEVVQEILQGKWGNGQERIDRLHEAGYAFENLQNAVNGTLGSTKRYETVMSDNEAVNEKVAESTKDLVTNQRDYKEEIKDSNQVIFEHSSIIDNAAYIVLGFSSAVKLVVSAVNRGISAFKKLSGGVHPVMAAFNLLMDILGNIGRHMYTFNTWLMSFESLGDAFEGVRKRASSLTDVFKKFGLNTAGISSIQKAVERVQGAFEGLKQRVTDVFDRIKGFATNNSLDTVRSKTAAIGNYVGGALLVVVEKLADGFNKAYETGKQLWDKLSELTAIQKIQDAFEEAKSAVKGFWDNLGSTTANLAQYDSVVSSIANGIGVITRVVGTLFTQAFNIAVKAIEQFEKATQDVLTVFSGDGEGSFAKASEILQKFKEVLMDLPNIVSNFFKSLNGGKIPDLGELSWKLYDLWEALKSFGNGLKTNFTKLWQDFIGNLVTGMSQISSIQMPESLGKVVDAAKSALLQFQDFTGTAGGTVTDFVTNVIDKVKKLDLRGGALTALIGAIALFAARWSKVGKNASGALKALTTFIKSGGKTAATTAEKFSGFVKIAAGLVAIAGAIWILGQVPAERFKECAFTLLIAFGAMFAAIAYLSSEKRDGDKLKAAGLALAGVGAGILLLAVAVEHFAKLDAGTLGKGLLLVGAAIAGMVLAINKTGNVSEGTGEAFAGLAAGVLILSIAVRSFAAIPFGDLVKGGIAVAAFVFIMAKAMSKVGESKGEGFIGLAGSIVILTIAIKSLARMKISALAKGGIVVIALITAMALASRSMKDVNGDAFKGMASAIRVLAAAMLILSKIPTLQLIVVTAALVVIFKSLKEAVETLRETNPKDSLKIALALIALLAPIGLCIYLLTKFTNTNAALKIALGIAAVIWALGEAGPGIAALSKIKFADGIKAIALADIFFVSIAALLGVLGKLNEKTEGAVGNSIVEGANVIGRAIHGFLEGLIFGEKDPATILGPLGDALSNFVPKIQGFIKTLQDTDPSVGENAKNLAVAILAICGAEVLDAISGWIRGKSDFEGFGEAITSVTNAIMTMNESVAGGNYNAKEVDKVIKAIKSMTEIANELPKQDGMLQGITGVQDLGAFGAQMADFIENGFTKFARQVSAIGKSLNASFIVKVSIIKSATKALCDLANDIPPVKSDFMAFFTGKQDLGQFASQMASFMSGGFLAFVDSVSKMPNVDVIAIKTQIVPATSAMISLGEKLKENTSILSYFTKDNDLSLFGKGLAGFGKGLVEFSDSISGGQIDISTMEAVKSVIEKYATLNANQDLAENGMYLFSSSITNLGAALAAFFGSVEGITPEYMTSMIDKLSSLHNVLLVISATDYSGVSGFAAALEELASSGVGAFLKEFEEASSGAAGAAQSLVKVITTAISVKLKDFTEMGAKSVLFYISGLTTKHRVLLNSAGKGIVAKAVAAIRSKAKDFNTAGGECALKFCAGLSTKYKGMLEGAGKSIANSALEGVKGHYDDFYREGQNAAEGYKEGIRSKASEAATEARNMVRDAINEAKATQQSASPSKVFRRLGGDGGSGYGLGFVDMIGFVKQSVTKTATAGIMAMKKSIEQMNSLVGDEIDYAPTITPVMDLSLLTSGVQTTQSMLGNLNNVTTDVQAALDIAALHNNALAQAKIDANKDYSTILEQLNNNTRRIIDAANRNRVAVIDGDQAFNYINRRFGMA